ncbi:MAG TPA: ZPR1 zinc finger domain-containing protein [Hadesarchaea archaeon]|nr:ZPR1 zinc finger domain-containing protein [Hadesarchaea archaeon]
MLKREFVLPGGCCPICGAKDAFQVKGKIDNIPYFGETMETLVSCSNCKFKHADVMHLEKQEPMRYEFYISSEKDLMVRVVKSSTGVIKIPELGVTVKPGSWSGGYISNIEGVIDRIEKAIEVAIEKANSIKRRRGETKLKKLEAIRGGKEKAKIIVMDPFGHSAIVDERVKKRELTKKELAGLKAEL